MKHQPVLLQEIIEMFQPLQDRKKSKDLRYFDGTLGRGGHLKAVLENFPGIQAVAIDRDPQALQEVGAEIQSDRLSLHHDNFYDFSAEKYGQFDLMLVDLGVSSPQLDEASRGFSFYQDGPLDMRMDPTQGFPASDIVNEASEDDLFNIFKKYGEVYHCARVVRAILARRQEKRFTSTMDLSYLIEKTDGWRRKGFHPATNYFMALRIATNDELRGLERSLPALRSGLKPGGRLAVLTFHSLEDRLVKSDFRGSEDFGKPVNKKVIVPTREEELANPRSRSAKLRVYERSGNEAGQDVEVSSGAGSSKTNF